MDVIGHHDTAIKPEAIVEARHGIKRICDMLSELRKVHLIA